MDDADYIVDFGKANLVREGDDVTIIGYSGSVHQAYRAADMLKEQEGLTADVIDLRTLRPLDIDTVIKSVKKTNRAVIVEDDWKFGGFAGEVEGALVDLDPPAAGSDGFHGSPC